MITLDKLRIICIVLVIMLSTALLAGIKVRKDLNEANEQIEKLQKIINENSN